MDLYSFKLGVIISLNKHPNVFINNNKNLINTSFQVCYSRHHP